MKHAVRPKMILTLAMFFLWTLLGFQALAVTDPAVAPNPIIKATPKPCGKSSAKAAQKPAAKAAAKPAAKAAAKPAAKAAAKPTAKPAAKAGEKPAGKEGGEEVTAEETGKELNPQQWLLRLPDVAKNKAQWRILVTQLLENGLDFGAMAAANRMLIFFDDLPTKEVAYKTIIDEADVVWPYSVRQLFVPGDIAPASADNFARSYNLYKALLNETAGMTQWAQNYYGRIDREKSQKYLFHVAIKDYKDGQHDRAIQGLRDILSAEKEVGQEYFLMKVARTLARIYYEKERYKESLEIYEKFLLKLNPINPTDWLEAAWNLYRLKRYTRALGYVYNMESECSGGPINIEKFVLRAAVYRDNCEAERMKALSNTFSGQYSKLLDGIRSGLPLDDYDDFHRLPIPENAAYVDAFNKLEGLRKEKDAIAKLPVAVQRLAQYLYRSEMSAQEVYLNLYKNDALLRSAEKLFTVSETLKFLSFDVAREKFNPNAVFETQNVNKEKFSERSLLNPRRQLAWRQFGDYWRDERLSLMVEIKNRCAE